MKRVAVTDVNQCSGIFFPVDAWLGAKEKYKIVIGVQVPGEKELVFWEIIFTHADVMGSGRFFYAEKGKELKLKL